MQLVFNIKLTFILFALQKNGMHGKKIATKSFNHNLWGNQKPHVKKAYCRSMGHTK